MKASRLSRDNLGQTITISSGSKKFTGVLFRVEFTEACVTVSLHHPGKPDILRHGWLEHPLDPRDEITVEDTE